MTHAIALQHGMGYVLHHFSDEAHARAWIAVNRIKNAKAPSAARGLRCLPDIDHNRDPYDARLESLAMTIETGEESDATPTHRPLPVAPQPQRRTYTSHGVVKVVTVGQPIGLLTPGGVIPAVVAHLGNNFITVNVAGTRQVERRTDATTVGPGLTLSAIVSPQSV